MLDVAKTWGWGAGIEVVLGRWIGMLRGTGYTVIDTTNRNYPDQVKNETLNRVDDISCALFSQGCGVCPVILQFTTFLFSSPVAFLHVRSHALISAFTGWRTFRSAASYVHVSFLGLVVRIFTTAPKILAHLLLWD